MRGARQTTSFYLRRLHFPLPSTDGMSYCRARRLQCAPSSMPRLIQLAKPFRPDRLTPVLRIKGVNVFVHWSVFAIAAIMLLGTIRRPVMTLVGVACYLSVILIHECGHMAAAQRKGYAVDGIFLYPIHGLCTFEMPWSRFDHCVIAWGGVLAQAAVALPLIVARSVWLHAVRCRQCGPGDSRVLQPACRGVQSHSCRPAGRSAGLGTDTGVDQARTNQTEQAP